MRAGEEGRGREGCSCLRLDSQEGCGISTARSGNESPERPQLMGPQALGKGWLKGLPGLSSCLPLQTTGCSCPASEAWDPGAKGIEHVTSSPGPCQVLPHNRSSLRDSAHLVIVRSSPIPGPGQGTQLTWSLSDPPPCLVLSKGLSSPGHHLVTELTWSFPRISWSLTSRTPHPCCLCCVFITHMQEQRKRKPKHSPGERLPRQVPSAAHREVPGFSVASTYRSGGSCAFRPPEPS